VGRSRIRIDAAAEDGQQTFAPRTQSDSRARERADIVRCVTVELIADLAGFRVFQLVELGAV
jgi:hypothetical protein